MNKLNLVIFSMKSHFRKSNWCKMQIKAIVANEANTLFEQKLNVRKFI